MKSLVAPTFVSEIPQLRSWSLSVISSYQQQAFLRLQTIADKHSSLRVLFTTPQTPPWHAEGFTVADHLSRMMGALDAICTDDTFLQLDVWRDHDLQLFIRDVRAACIKHSSLLLAFILTHDLAKAATVELQGQDDVGLREGFVGNRLATASEQERYLKLARAAGHVKSDVISGAKEAYDALHVRARYPLHDRLGASVHYAQDRLAILEFLQLDPSYARFLSTLIRVHLDALTVFSERPLAKRLEAFFAIADHAGINTALFQDLLPACLLLDGILGILPLHDGEYVIDARLLKHYFIAEREVLPARHEKRVLAERRVIRERIQAILETHDLSSERIFSELQTPVGPIRGEVMREIYHALREEGYVPNIGAQAVVFMPRITAARLALVQEHLPFL